MTCLFFPLKLAMGLKASNGKKQGIDRIFPRHFMQTAKSVKFAQGNMQQIFDELSSGMPQAITRVKKKLPDAIPEHISDAIFTHTLKMLTRLEQ